MDDCYACNVGETHPMTQLRGNADCLGCDARALAREFAGMPKDITDGVMRQAWPDTKTFETGRLKFWIWSRLIEEAKAKIP